MDGAQGELQGKGGRGGRGCEAVPATRMEMDRKARELGFITIVEGCKRRGEEMEEA